MSSYDASLGDILEGLELGLNLLQSLFHLSLLLGELDLLFLNCLSQSFSF